MLVVAPTRGGKGLLATAQLLTWPHSVVVNDIKGDLFEQTAGARSRFSDIYVIDPNGFGNRYNPLSGKTNHKDLLAASFSLLRRYGDSEGLIFFERGSVMLQQILIAALIEAEEARKQNHPVLAPLPYVQQMIYLGLPHAAQRLDDLSKAYGIYPNLATQLLESPIGEADLSDRFLLSCWATMTTKMRFLLSDPAVRSFAGSDFTAKNLLSANRPVTVYIRIPEEDVSVLAPLVRLMWDTIISDLLKIYDDVKGVNCRPVLLLIDEAGIPSLPGETSGRELRAVYPYKHPCGSLAVDFELGTDPCLTVNANFLGFSMELAITVGIVAYLLCWTFDLLAALAPTLSLAFIVVKLVILIIAVVVIFRGTGGNFLWGAHKL